MAQPVPRIWESKWFKKDTRDRARGMFLLMIKWGKEYEHSCRFVGYYMDRYRRKTAPTTDIGIKMFYDSANGTRGKYDKGENRDNFLKAGKILLQQIGKEDLGLCDDVDPGIVWDYLIERGE